MSEGTKQRRPQTSPTGAVERVVNDPVSRRKFMVLTGGSAAMAAFLAACGGDDEMTSSTTSSSTTSDSMSGGGMDPALADFGEGDIGILNYALTLEYLETAFYEDVVDSGLFKGSDLKTIRKFGQQEATHVETIKATVKQLGGKPAAKPKTEFPLDDAGEVLALAGTVENLGAAAYLGQAANIQSPDVLAAALSIHSVEARHAAALNTLLGETITPDGPFANPADAQTVLDAVQPFIVG